MTLQSHVGHLVIDWFQSKKREVCAVIFPDGLASSPLSLFEHMTEDRLHKTEEEEKNNDKAVVLFKKADEIMDINLLHKGFNLHNRPRNYLCRRTNIEEVVYHAVMADTIKSPYTSFKMANQYLSFLSEFDVLGGMRPIKRLVEMVFDQKMRTSTIVHKVGNLLLLDEFDIDSFILTSSSYGSWPWLREFMFKNNLNLNESDFTRQVLQMRDLYIKFLYHTVGHQGAPTHLLASEPRFQMLEFDRNDEQHHPSTSATSYRGNGAVISTSPSRVSQQSRDPNASTTSPESMPSNSRSRLSHNPDDYLRMAKWRLDDLSFLVGSDMAIFGTKMHPCISLRLSPLHEPINVLTGVDIWLENILNEVPEVAMCFHNEGIVMQEYEIYKTCDLPALTCFHPEHILRIIRNLIMFLKRNATQEGHTYWLVREAGFDVVKLYDLTVLCEKPRRSSSVSPDPDSDESDGVNPFILPVASLCYKLAERRVQQRELYLKRFSAPDSASGNCKTPAPSISLTSPTKSSTRGTAAASTASSEETDMDRYVEDLRLFLTDVFRLLRNCLNLIGKIEEATATRPPGRRSSQYDQVPSVSPHADLKARAVLLLCQLYLSTPSEDVIACATSLQNPTAPTQEVLTMELSAFATGNDGTHQQQQQQHDAAIEEVPAPCDQLDRRTAGGRKRICLGDSIIDAFKSTKTDQVSSLAVALFEAVCSPERTTIADSMPLSLAVVPPWQSESGSTTADGQESSLQVYTERRHRARRMMPFVLARSALTRAGRLWTRVFGATAQGLAPNLLSRLFEAVRLSFCSLFYFEHLLPDESKCPHCGHTSQPDDIAYLQQQQQESTVSSTSPIYLLASARRLALLAFHTLEDARQLSSRPSSGSWPAPSASEAAADRGFLFDNLLALCPPGHRLLLCQVDGAIHGPAYSQHVCKSLCTFTSPTECSLASWLDCLETIMYRCLKYLLPLLQYKSPAKRTARDAAAEGLATSKEFNSQVPLASLPKFWPISLNLFLSGLRRYWEIVQSSTEDPELRGRFEMRLVRAFDLLNDPLFNSYRDLLSTDLRVLLCTLQFQAVKLATVAASHVLIPRVEPPNLDDGRGDGPSGKQQLPLVMRCLCKAIDALVPGLNIFTEQSPTDLRLLSSLTSDLLRTAIEYSAIGMREFSQQECKPYWLLEDVSNVLKRVQKLLPFQLNSLFALTGDPSSSTGRRKGVTGSSVLEYANFGPEIVRCVVYFRLHTAKVALLQVQYSHLAESESHRGPMHNPTVWSGMVGQMRAAITWLDRNLPPQLFEVRPSPAPRRQKRSVRQQQESVASVAYPPTFAEDALLYISAVVCFVSLQIVHVEVLSESGIHQLIREALGAHPVVASLSHWLTSLGKDGTAIPEEDLCSNMLQLDRILQCLVSTLYTKTTNQRSVDIALEAKKKKRRARRGAGGGGSGNLAGNTGPTADSGALQQVYTLLKPNLPSEANSAQDSALKFIDKDTPTSLPEVSYAQGPSNEEECWCSSEVEDSDSSVKLSDQLPDDVSDDDISLTSSLILRIIFFQFPCVLDAGYYAYLQN
nr:unnamed protein product [Spirometra erinaceieuropaei]